MKKFIIIAATAFVSLSSFASVDPVTGKVLESFRSEFADAKNVQWKSLDDAGLYQATFNFRNTELSAFYNADGEMVATARYISIENLPILVTKAIQDRYPDHIVKNVIEHISGGNTTYHITLHGQKSSMIVSATPSGNISVFKKVKNKL
ncbi:hypothetical protein [Flavihumibacter petaseus]|uniref:Beta-lactamase-inhibitor-like PepSY-like domain-containing protein n=1 Tax=Flavihumibacter petaseus NBRC 106054 TaxID=1220578 RepID=A0A0E9MY30_9BACT|nr:hypothetical protein [Flavihumibacter petaseus]GAO42398.1 hypothetical protein FPE01S_01_14130 [Flavihumibacter petaseus NBRC 106054]